MANGNEEFVDVTTTEQSPQDTGEFTDVTSGEVDADQVDQEYNYIAGNADSWFSIVQDPTTGGYGIEVPDIDFSFAKFDEETDDDTPEKLTAVESLKNTWNNSLDQLSLVDDRFYWLSEQLFGDEDSLTFKEAEARIAASEKAQQEKGIEGGTLALTDIPDAFEEEGFIGGLAHTGAAIANAVAAFGTSAIESVATGGVGLAVDMVSGSVRDYAKARAEEEGISIEEASRNLGAETIIPVGLGALSYSFEKAGLKGVGKAIKGMAPSAKKALFNVMNASGKEGATELAQGVVESFNQGFAGKRSLDEATESVGDFWEHEALETFLQGAVGGGVTAGGGRSARKAASQLRSNEAERSIVETTEKISKIDEQLNDPNVSPEQKKVLKRARTALKNEFKAAIKEPNKDVQKLNDDQINQINKRGDKINELKKELDVFEQEAGGTVGAGLDLATQAVKEDINKRIQKEIDGINKIYENRSTTNIRTEDGTPLQTEATNEVDRAFKEGDIATAWEKGLEAYKPLIRSTARKLWGGEARGEKFENFVEDLTYGLDNDQSHSFVGLMNAYRPEVGSFGGWAKSQLENRGKRVLDKTVKRQTESTDEYEAQTGKKVDQAAEDAPVEIIKGTAPKKVANRLGLSPQVAQTVNDKVANVLKTQKIVKPTTAGFNKAVSKQARTALKKDIMGELGKGDQFFRNLTQNWKKYLNVIPKNSLAQSRGETQGWAETPPTQEEFVNYMRGDGATAQQKYNRREKLAEWISDGLFNEAAAELLQDPVVQKEFELANEIKEDGGKAVNAARIALINKTPISENRINAPKGTIQLVEGTTAADQMTSILDQAWKAQGHKVQSTTNKKLAVANLVMAGIFPNKLAAEAYLEDVNGFTFTKRNGTNFIYNDSSVGLATPIHEMGHVWSGFVLDNNPNLWAQVMTEIVKDPAILMRQDNRLINAGYYSKFGKQAQEFMTTIYNQPERAQNLINKVVQNPGHFANEIQALDEIMAGAIEVHGKNQLKKEDNALTKALNKFWDYIGKLLAKVQGKEIQDLTSGELLDLAVNDVLTGKPGSSFAEMNIPVGNAQFEASAGSYRSQKEYDAKAEAEYKAMNIISKDSSNDGINKAYAEVADHMSKDEFLDWMLKESKANKLDLTKLQSTFLEDDADSGSVEKAWQELAGGKLTLLLGRPGKAWQNDQSKIQEKFDKNFEFFKKNEALWTSALPSEFWETLGRLKKDGTQAKESILRYEDAQYLAGKAKPSGVNFSNRDAFSRIETASKKIANIRKLGNDAKYQQEVDDNQQVLFILGDAIQQLAEQGVDKVELASFIKSFTNTGHDVTNFFRKAPRLTGYIEGIENAKKRIPEHNPPAGYIAQFLFQRASTGNFNQEAKDAIKDKFKYYLVPPSFDPGVKGLGPTSLKAGITKGFDLVKDDPFIRYAVTGADVTQFRDLDGKPTVEKYGVDVNAGTSAEVGQAVLREEVGALKESFRRPEEISEDDLKLIDLSDRENTAVLFEGHVGGRHYVDTVQAMRKENRYKFYDYLNEKGIKPRWHPEDDIITMDDVQRGYLATMLSAEVQEVLSDHTVADLLLRGKEAEYISGSFGYDKDGSVDAHTADVIFNFVPLIKVDGKKPFKSKRMEHNPGRFTIVATETAKRQFKRGKFNLNESRKVDPSQQFNEILSKKTGVAADKQFDKVDVANAAKKFKLGKFWLPPSAEDLKGLIYSMIPGGAEGNAALEFFDQQIFRPYSSAIAQYNKEKLAAFDSVKKLAKKFDLNKDVAEGLTADQAIRIYLFQQTGQEVTGVDQAKIDAANDYVENTQGVKGLVGKILKNTGNKYDQFEADTWVAGSLQADMFGYFNDSRRKELLQEWKDNKDAIFTPENMDKLRVTHGEQFVASLENTFKRQWSGRNRTIAPDSSTNKLMDWLNNAVGTTMFLNMRSAALQSLSTINYLFEPGTIRGMLSPEFAGNVVKLWNSDYLRARRGESGFDMQASEVAGAVKEKNGFKKLVAKLIQAGFAPTKAVDSLAISFLGAAYYTGQIKKGATEQEALRKWQEVSEENQQSARPDKISKIQAGPLGRIIFAFGNTPFQYARLTKRGIQDVLSGRSKARGTLGKDLAKLSWYGAIQSLIFTQLQNAVGLFDDEEEDETAKEWAINSFITSYLKAFGPGGAIASAIYPLIADMKKVMEGERVKGEQFLLDAVSVSPPIQSRLRKLNKIIKEAQYRPDELVDPTTESFWKTLGYGLNVGANVPLDRAIEKLDNLGEIVNEDHSAWTDLLLFFGYKQWQLDETKNNNKKKKDDDGFEDVEFDDDGFTDVEFEDDGFEDVPFNRGAVGQANRDGTIDVEPGLSPLERKKTIAHEKEHVRQMEEEGLDYDDGNVYYMGKRHKRKEGKIRYANKWVPEGDPRLPWEAKAFAVE